MPFLPANYVPVETPSNGGLFMKLQEGENKIRIIAPPLTGYVYWGVDDKPYRLRNFIDRPYNMREEGQYGPEKVKHFWALTVWDYGTQSVRVLEITQSVIREQIMKLDADVDWGDPRNYNLKIVKTVKNINAQRKEVKYSVIPSPSANVPEMAIASLNENPIDLNALYFGGKPNDQNWKIEARNVIYKWIGELYNEAAIRNVQCESVNFDALQLSQCLDYYESLLETVSKTPVTSTSSASTIDLKKLAQSPATVAASADEIPF